MLVKGKRTNFVRVVDDHVDKGQEDELCESGR